VWRARELAPWLYGWVLPGLGGELTGSPEPSRALGFGSVALAFYRYGRAAIAILEMEATKIKRKSIS
jgi:hypothetical protein